MEEYPDGRLIAIIAIPALILGLLVNKGYNAVAGSSYDDGYERGVIDCRKGRIQLEVDTTITYKIRIMPE